MDLVCYLLPDMVLAGSPGRLAISAETGLAMSWLESGKSGSEPEKAADDGAGDPAGIAGIDIRHLLAHSPHLLIWCLARQDPSTPVASPAQLATHACGVELQPLSGYSELTIRFPWRRRRFRRQLQRLDQTLPHDTTAGKQMRKAVVQCLVRIVARASGGSRQQARDWLEQWTIEKGFWVRLAAFSRFGQPLILAPDRNQPRPGGSGEQEFLRRLHEEKMASLKRLAYGASHEINNPLANIASRAQTLLLDETDRERRRTLAKINQQAFRAHEMIADMMLFAHPPRPELRSMDPGPVVHEVAGEMQAAADDQATILEADVTCLPAVQGDPAQLAVAIRALVQNALESLGRGGRVVISAASCDADQAIEICVSDDGPGFDEGLASHVFDPFFSGREAGRGLGFGLPKAWRITKMHRGEIFAENPPHGGARVRIRIPYRVDAA